MTNQEKKFINDLGERLDFAIKNPTKVGFLKMRDFRSKMDRYMKNSLVQQMIEKAVKEDMKFKKIYEDYQRSKKSRVKKAFASIALPGILVTGFGCQAFNNSERLALQKTEEAQEIKDLETETIEEDVTDYRALPEKQVEYDEVFDADAVDERETRIQNFLTHAKELGYGEDTFDIQQLMEVYTILNLEHLSAEEFAALNPGTLNVKSMMEHFGDFGIKVGEAAMVSTSDRHLSISELVSDKQDSEYLKELEKLMYSYNDKNTDRKAVAQQITDLIWKKTVQGQSVDNATQTIGYYLGYYGNILSVNNKGAVIFGDDTQFEEVFGKEIDTKAESACGKGCSVEICGEQSQFAESYTDTEKVLSKFIESAEKFAFKDEFKFYEPQYQWKAIESRIAEALEKVPLGEKIDINKYRDSYSPYKDDNYHEKPYAGQLTQEEASRIITDSNGNNIIVNGGTTQAEIQQQQQEQTEQQQIINQDALKTEASSAAVAQAQIDAKTGNYNNAVPARYQGVSDAWKESYDIAYYQWVEIYALQAQANAQANQGTTEEFIPVETPAQESVETPETEPIETPGTEQDSNSEQETPVQEETPENTENTSEEASIINNDEFIQDENGNYIYIVEDETTPTEGEQNPEDEIIIDNSGIGDDVIISEEFIPVEESTVEEPVEPQEPAPAETPVQEQIVEAEPIATPIATPEPIPVPAPVNPAVPEEAPAPVQEEVPVQEEAPVQEETPVQEQIDQLNNLAEQLGASVTEDNSIVVEMSKTLG